MKNSLVIKSIFYLFLCFKLTFAQVNPIANISVKDGLPSNKVYDLALGNASTLWVATQNGIAAINGNKIKTYSEKDGLPHNDCWQIIEDDKQLIWVGTYGGGLSYFDGEQFTTINEDNGLVYNKIRKLFYYKSNLYVGTQNGLSVVNTITKSVKNYNLKENRLSVMDFFVFKDEIYLITFNTGSYKLTDTDLIKVNDEKELFTITTKNDSLLFSKDGNAPSLKSIHKIATSDFLKNRKNYTKFGGSVFWDIETVGSKTYGAAWGVNFDSGGFYEINNESIKKINLKYNLPSNIIYKILNSPETQQLYLATLDKGIYIIDTDNMVSFNSKANLKCALTTFQNDLILGFDDYLEIEVDTISSVISKSDFLNFISGEIQFKSLSKRYPSSLDIRSFSINTDYLASVFKILSIKEFDYNQYVNTSIGVFKITKSNNKFKIDNYYPVSTTSGFYIDSQIGFLFQKPYAQVLNLSNHNNAKDLQRFDLNNPDNPRDIIQFIELKNQLVGISRFKGIYRFVDNKFTSLYSNGLIKDKEFVLASKLSESSFLVSDYTGNIFKYETNDSADSTVFNKIINANNLIGNTVTGLAPYKNYIIVSTNFGLNIFDTSSGAHWFFDEEQGIDAKNIIDLELKGDNLELITSKGIYTIQLKKWLNTSIPISFCVTSVKVNGVEENSQRLSNSGLSYNENRFNINLDVKFVKHPKKFSYRYKIDGLQDANWTDWLDWGETKAIDIPYLPPGDFKIEAEYKYLATGQVGKEVVLELKINKPYWRTFGFYSVSILLILSLAFLLIRQRYKIILKKKIETFLLRQRITEVKMEALRSQMNPHFIFNAINAIQNFVIQNDTDSSLNYMNSFSSLIRKTLDYSSRSKITVKEELKFLKLFVKIQNLRFGNRVKFTVNIQKGIDKNIVKIPPMLLQPIIENCFEHAFNDSVKSPEIVLSFELEDVYLIITVKDNGIGFVNKSEYTSKGMTLVSERLTLLNDKNQLDYNSSKKGTIVAVHILL